MKNQFVRINTPQGKEKIPGGPPLSNTRVLTDAQPGASPAPLQRSAPPTAPAPHRPPTNVLPHSQSGRPNPSTLAGINDFASIEERDTLEQQAVNSPQTGPALHPNSPQARYANGPFGRVSPHDSGISPVRAPQPNAQMFSPPQAPLMPSMPPMQRPPSQPLPPRGPVGPAGPGGPRPPYPFNQPGPRNPQSEAAMMPFALSAASMMGAPPSNYKGSRPLEGPGPLPPEKGGADRKRKKRRVPIWARVVISFVAFLLVLIGVGGGYYYFNFSAPVSHIVGQSVARTKNETDPNVSRNGADILSGPRINILLLGSDTDQKFNGGSYLAQSDIVITIDPATKQVGMLSIPRDFYINVPGYGMHKLDEAFGVGMQSSGFPGGVQASRLTIEQDFGISINYYAWVGLDGFVKVIDTVGGVDVDVLHPITDDTYPDDVGNHTGDIYAYKRLYIPAGPQHLSGPEALEYVRSRHADLVGDFGRSARQQQVLSALKLKLNGPGIIGKLPEIAHDLDGFVKTDMQLTDVLKLMNFARGLDAAKINRVILGPPYSQTGNLPDGTSVVFPNCTQIVPVIAKMFALGNQAACNIQANSGSTPQVASTGTGSPLASSASANGASPMTSQLMTLSNMNMPGANDLSGIHSLLDLMLMTVFESPEAIQA